MCEENKVNCQRCGTEYEHDNDFSVVIVSHRGGTDQWCGDCVADHSFVCADCNDVLDDSLSSGDNTNGDSVCSLCSENYYYCECCSSTVDVDNYYGDGLCCSCHDDNDDNDDSIIGEYHSSKNKIEHKGRFRSLTPKIGIELEIECCNNRRLDVASDIKELALTCGFHLENDSSLDNGFEMVSNALTFKEHKKLSDHRKKLLDKLSKKGCKSHDVSSCGLHVHISKKYLSNLDQEFMVNFFNVNENTLEKFARRSCSSYAEFNNFSTSKDDRYSAVNLTNRNTVEFRIFKGTLKHETLFATLEFVNQFYLYVKQDKQKNWKWPKFLEYIKKKHCPNLKAYLIEKNIDK